MLLRSGRTYLPNLNMEAKLNLILKELGDLKLRVDGWKSKYNKETLETCVFRRENHNDRRRDESTNMLRINKDAIICRIRIDPLTFDGILGPKVFSDWMADLDYYFDCRFTEESTIQILVC